MVAWCSRCSRPMRASMGPLCESCMAVDAGVEPPKPKKPDLAAEAREWKTRCFAAEVKSQRLWIDNEQLRDALRRATNRTASNGARASNGGVNGHLTPERLKSLLMLVHPDKHGNSPLSNDVTRWLLDVRRGT